MAAAPRGAHSGTPAPRPRTADPRFLSHEHDVPPHDHNPIVAFGRRAPYGPRAGCSFRAVFGRLRKTCLLPNQASAAPRAADSAFCAPALARRNAPKSRMWAICVQGCALGPPPGRPELRRRAVPVDRRPVSVAGQNRRGRPVGGPLRGLIGADLEPRGLGRSGGRRNFRARAGRPNRAGHRMRPTGGRRRLAKARPARSEQAKNFRKAGGRFS